MAVYISRIYPFQRLGNNVQEIILSGSTLLIQNDNDVSINDSFTLQFSSNQYYFEVNQKYDYDTDYVFTIKIQ